MSLIWKDPRSIVIHNMHDIVLDFILFLIEKTWYGFYQSYYKTMFQLHVITKC